MAKKKDPKKCAKCGFPIALAVIHFEDCEVVFDQEPYDANVVEAVIIDKQCIESVEICGSFDCHICPKCNWFRDIETNDPC